MKKLFAFVALALATPAFAQSSLPLSQSTTFQNLKGRVDGLENGTLAKLSGDQIFHNKVCAESLIATNFCLAKGTGPYVNFVDGSYIQWNPNTLAFEIFAANNKSVEVNSGAATTNVPLAIGAGATGALNPPSGAPGFFLSRNGTRPYIAFDGINSRLEFSNSGNFVFYIGASPVMSIDGNGNMKLRGSSIQYNQTITP